jgi:hypothetical protein
MSWGAPHFAVDSSVLFPQIREVVMFLAPIFLGALAGTNYMDLLMQMKFRKGQRDADDPDGGGDGGSGHRDDTGSSGDAVHGEGGGDGADAPFLP